MTMFGFHFALFCNFCVFYNVDSVLLQAIYEKMLVELPFAAFFLSKILGRHGNVDIHHLVSLDPELYR